MPDSPVLASLPNPGQPRPSRRVVVGQPALFQASRIFRALGDWSRLRLLARLAAGEACVSAVVLAEQEELSTVSHRLSLLYHEGLVSRRRQGKNVLYSLTNEHVATRIDNALNHAADCLSDRRSVESHE